MTQWHPEMLASIEKAKRLIAKAKSHGKSDGFSRYKIKAKEGKQ